MTSRKRSDRRLSGSASRFVPPPAPALAINERRTRGGVQSPTLPTARRRCRLWRERQYTGASLGVVTAERGYAYLSSYVCRNVRDDDLMLRLSDHVEQLAAIREIDVDVVVDRHRRANRRLALAPADLERVALTAEDARR